MSSGQVVFRRVKVHQGRRRDKTHFNDTEELGVYQSILLIAKHGHCHYYLSVCQYKLVDVDDRNSLHVFCNSIIPMFKYMVTFLIMGMKH